MGGGIFNAVYYRDSYKKMKKSLVIFGNGLVSQGIQKTINESGKYYDLTIYTREKFIQDSVSVIKTALMEKQPGILVLAIAATSGIIGQKSREFDIEIENRRINDKIIEIIKNQSIEKLYNFVPACVYPTLDKNRLLKPSDLGNGLIEPSSALFANTQIERMNEINKLASQNQSWINLISTNIIGSHQRKNKKDNHVLPALLESIGYAKKNNESEVKMLGSGKTVRDFIWNHDIGRLLHKLIRSDNLNVEERSALNIAGTGPITIEHLSIIVASALDFKGKIVFKEDSAYSGASFKLLEQSKSITKMNLELTSLHKSIDNIIKGN
jgi:nucleoside-diphosphate-sugar epimerase